MSIKYGNIKIGGGVLQHIAIAYAGAWLLLRLPGRGRAAAAVGVLAGAWAAFTYLPGPGGDAGTWAEGTTFSAAVDIAVLGGSAVKASFGICMLLFAAAYAAVDVRGWQRPFGLLRVLGLNALALYASSQVVFNTLLRPHRDAIAAQFATVMGGGASLTYAMVAVGAGCALCAVLYRRRIFLTV